MCSTWLAEFSRDCRVPGFDIASYLAESDNTRLVVDRQRSRADLIGVEA
jgi:hypothetical protein